MAETLAQEPIPDAMVRAYSDVLLEAFPCFGNRLVCLLLAARNLSTKGIGLAHLEELLEEGIGTTILGSDNFMVGIDPLLFIPMQWKQEEAKGDGIRSDSFDREGATHLHKMLKVCVRIHVRLSIE